MKRVITPLFLILTLILPLYSVEVKAQIRTEVYTKFVQGNFNHSGDGSAASPYNLFVDALDAVADGGTIYIMDGGAFINDTSDGMPFEINKNITISAQPNAATYPMLSVRTSGIVLGADVTFKNIELSFSNPIRPILCANGYSLVMDNVFYSKSTQKIHLAGGGMYLKNGVSASPESGEHGSITVKGSKSLFGNIYAGSINGSFDKPVDITVCDVAGANIGKVYSSGAEEGYYDSGNFLDPDNFPEDPEADFVNFPLHGDVSVEINDSGVSEIYGTTGGNKSASVIFSTRNLRSCFLTDISSLELKKGELKVMTMNNGADLAICEGAVLDISDMDMISVGNLEVNNFNGGGVLVLAKEDCLVIKGQCTGETELRTNNGLQSSSGIALYNHMYIKTDGDGIFTFNPYPSQQHDMRLEKRDGGWGTSQQTEEEALALTSFDIPNKLIYVKPSVINGENPPEIEVNAEFTGGGAFVDIGMIPFGYSVTYKGEKFMVPSTPLADIDEYYEGDIEELNMNFAPIGSAIMISNFSSSLQLGEIAEGIYEIEITAPTVTGNVICSFVLVVSDEIPETQEQFDVAFENGKAEVIFTNTSEQQIDNAVMILCAYDNGVIKTVKPADDKITLKSGETKVVHFNIEGIDYNKLKIMVWDSFEKMTPICNYYEKK